VTQLGAFRRATPQKWVGLTRSVPSKNRTISSRVRKVIWAEPCWFQNWAAWIIGSASTSVVGCEMTRSQHHDRGRLGQVQRPAAPLTIVSGSRMSASM